MSAAPQILVAALGNLPMPLTRHSLGQYVLDALASRLGIRMSSDRKGIVGRGIVTLGDTPVSLILYKSKSFMNVSGPSIAEIYRTSVKSPNAMIVLQDSMSHKVEQLSVKLGGSANGHNGVKSIISALGGEQGFYRFRLGIGERGATDAATFVMGKLTPHERAFWTDEGLDRVLDEMEVIVRKAAH
ncbi:peptidyl-tRNA hydrolase [Lentinula raphanica]|uniref:peptidyl-tRNA hydrolase n=1 Tax=Lentinula raphanica TaxID=153919 RepID=A0AA38UAL8_9AGAR|nr:peptidyl-tRNA hydrolase [Lentinula raphanica]KAJ3767302.1 peptidyl-tRNA hydrolase [Lentinula raphanica]KAJ3821122.1 peptidyl-tRNA hydrolase [Lentinula raphanica]KAJ3835767.1 peptidyl-tRNA hydrolase [Lentinula raphanica]KAJ3968421.1 peptidyl-tRNA hydrolase [Lentinula raphanica]